MLLNGLILAAVVVSGLVLMAPRLAGATGWHAMITPLASIIGSGFLVLGPILDASYGLYAPLVMAVLCIAAYLFGWAVRFNIAVIEADGDGRGTVEEVLETAASWSLAFAYVISVAYYLNLFGAFGVSLTDVNDALHAKLLTSAMLALILIVGWAWGFKALESLEQISVSIKLAIIAGLLAGLVVYFSHKMGTGALVLNPPVQTGWGGVALAFGLIVTVQGFETSRYLGANYDAAMRILSMRRAQWLSSAIYMIYIGLLAYVFAHGTVKLQETAIVEMMRVVAPVLPAILVAAALSAQFSAAVADTGGCGGLIAELTRKRFSPRQAYVVVVALGLALTWGANIFEIISYASRAFAVYYALQAAIAASGAVRRGDGYTRTVVFAGLAVLGALIALFGQPVES